MKTPAHEPAEPKTAKATTITAQALAAISLQLGGGDYSKAQEEFGRAYALLEAAEDFLTERKNGPSAAQVSALGVASLMGEIRVSLDTAADNKWLPFKGRHGIRKAIQRMAKNDALVPQLLMSIDIPVDGGSMTEPVWATIKRTGTITKQEARWVALSLQAEVAEKNAAKQKKNLFRR